MSLKLSQILLELLCLFSVYIYHDVGVSLVIGQILSCQSNLGSTHCALLKYVRVATFVGINI